MIEFFEYEKQTKERRRGSKIRKIFEGILENLAICHRKLNGWPFGPRPESCKTNTKPSSPDGRNMPVYDVYKGHDQTVLDPPSALTNTQTN